MLVRGAVHEESDTAADASGLRTGDVVLLRSHQTRLSPPFGARRHVVGKGMSGRAFLVRIREDPDMVET